MAFIHNLKTLEERKWGEGKDTLYLTIPLTKLYSFSYTNSQGDNPDTFTGGCLTSCTRSMAQKTL